MTRNYVLTREDPSCAYFVRLGLGIFWECSCNPDDARQFKTRQAAAKVLTENGKQRQGWRVIATDQIPAKVTA